MAGGNSGAQGVVDHGFHGFWTAPVEEQMAKLVTGWLQDYW
jgi:hypothetical protein